LLIAAPPPPELLFLKSELTISMRPGGGIGIGSIGSQS
jgi:hypothetical protein